MKKNQYKQNTKHMSGFSKDWLSVIGQKNAIGAPLAVIFVNISNTYQKRVPDYEI